MSAAKELNYWACIKGERVVPVHFIGIHKRTGHAGVIMPDGELLHLYAQFVFRTEAEAQQVLDRLRAEAAEHRRLNPTWYPRGVTFEDKNKLTG